MEASAKRTGTVKVAGHSPVRRLGPGRMVLESLTGGFRAGREEALQVLSHRMTA